MKERILKGWNVSRIIYTLLGVTIIIQSAVQHEWIGILLGGYFASMGIFSFGCASGICYRSPYRPFLKNEENTKEKPGNKEMN